MAIEIAMPQLSDTMDNGKILSWLVKEGDEVGIGDALAEVATDKADLEVESFHVGTIAKILKPVGETVKVGEIIAVIAEPGEDVSALPSPAASAPSPAAAPASNGQSTAQPAAVAQTSSPSISTGSGDRLKISPLAKNLAKSKGVDVSGLQGSGEGGRIVKKDIEAAVNGNAAPVQQAAPAPQAKPASPAPQPQVSAAPIQGATIEPLSSMRKTIASRMVLSKTTIPHFVLTGKIVMDAVVDLRSSLKTMEKYEGITFNHIIVKAAALALRKVPIINAAYKDENLVHNTQVNIGVVTAVEGGLLIPVLKNADTLPLVDVVSESKALVHRARTGRPKGTDLTGGTFSISNVGAFAVESFTAIINPDQGAILAVGSIDDEVVVDGDDIRVAKVMRASLSVDHRIIDGVQAAEFITEFKKLLEDPVLLLA